MKKISPDTLRKLLAYDPETGVLTWLPRHVDMFSGGKYPADRMAAAWNAARAGKPAFTAENSEGYRKGTLFGLTYRAHRVAWALHYGEWPVDQIDHINGNRSDNRIANLRDVSNAENQRNQKRSAANTSGVSGVIWHSRDGKWQARIKADGCQKHLGYFADFDAAVSARKAAEHEFGFHQNHGRN